MSRLCRQPGHRNSGARPVYLGAAGPSGAQAALGGHAHSLEVNVPEADAPAVHGVGDGPVHHLHLLRLHSAGSPRVPAEVVGAGVHVEPGGGAGTVTPRASRASGADGTQRSPPAPRPRLLVTGRQLWLRRRWLFWSLSTKPSQERGPANPPAS